ncbi:MAG TPA: aldolase/citrate lyase family protein [Tabrizicola sp.]|nr:aldolase/citrate lyase family protein [Tabrizicola sp.]
MTNLRSLWAEGKATLNGWCMIGNPFVAEIMAAQGFDSITVDMQHGALDYTDLLPMLQAMRASGSTLMARVPWLDPAAVMKALDAGAEGIICPMVNTAADAARLVSYLRYPPLGERSFGPTRATFAHGPDYAAKSNASTLAFAMVETAEAFANLDAIAATPGLDGIYVGPADLSLSLSNGALKPGLDRQEPKIVDALQQIAAACQKNNIIAALHCATPEYAQKAVGWGYRMVTVGADVRFLTEAAGTAVRSFRTLTAAPAAPQTGPAY